jgi:hypothetical protein
MPSQVSGFSRAAIFDQGSGAVAARAGAPDAEFAFPDASAMEALSKHCLALKAAGATGVLDDIVVTLSDEIQFLTPIDSTGVLFVAASRDVTNVALLRSVAARCAQALRNEVPHL